MESAYLTQAHDHARNAATATAGTSVATAGQEHHLAATAFRDATQDTANVEALRILTLLEDHHRKLAGLIKEAPREEKRKVTKQPSEASAASPPPKISTSRTTPSTTSSPTPPTSRRRLPQSSIATNLAEKRGIPSAKRTSSGTAVSLSGVSAGINEQPSTPVRDLLAQQSRKADSSSARDSPQQLKASAPKPTSPPAEDNFRRFYSAFGGVISAISAPLAFTSLPLNPTAPTPVSEAPKEAKTSKGKSRTQSPEAARTVKSSVPDLAALISKPALRALRADGAPPLGPNESFYLVPTSGGTVTYASVLRDPNAPQNTHLTPTEGSGSMKGSSHEEFVDARENLNVGPPSPTQARRPHSTTAAVTAQRSIPAGRGAGLKTMEELALENDTLKAVIDKQAQRIQMWELNSQNSFNALAQSFRARGPGRNSSDQNALAQALAAQALPSPPIAQQPSPPDTDAAKRIADLEAALSSQSAKVTDLMSNNEQLAKTNERNTQVLSRYREQWEKLKAGARKKEQERRERKGADGKGVDGKGTETGKEEEEGAETVGDGEEEDVEEEPGFGKA